MIVLMELDSAADEVDADEVVLVVGRGAVEAVRGVVREVEAEGRRDRGRVRGSEQ